MSHTPKSVSPASFLTMGGDMGRRISEFDWAEHPLGPPESWPQSLLVAIRIMLTSRFAMWMGWGPEFYFFCNDAYAPTLGIKRDRSLGLSARKVWEEIWQDIGPRAESVVQTGQATWDESLLLFLERSGYPEETYHTFSYSPLPQDDGSIGGMLCVVTEETERVIGERRLASLRDFGADLAGVKSEEGLLQAIQTGLQRSSRDLPFALVYHFDAEGKTAHLVCAHHAEAGTPLAAEIIAIGGEDQAWPAASLLKGGEPVLVADLEGRFGNLPVEPWGKPPRSALLVPIAQQGLERVAGFLVAGLNPYRPLDPAYRGFLDLFVGQIAAGLASARAYEAERQRAEALAEIDRAKTAFFSNVSHEFRTPLTLLLGPLEEIVNKPKDAMPAEDRELVAVAHRNAIRLLRLVNSLLDFARLEAGRTKAHFELTDLAAFTAELASSFRSAMEKAGLRFIVECPPLPEPVFLDREMWEKIVLNLLSNAFKFTLQGEVQVTVRALDGAAELRVQDSGTGIPTESQPHLFERFFRVIGAEGRTHEGSGIGLALVHELVKLHGGTVRAESQPGRGSTFIVTIPWGAAHLPAEQVAPANRSTTGGGANAFVAEALRWLPHGGTGDGEVQGEFDSFGDFSATGARPRILLADDNADMRDYVARLLSSLFDVTAVADGRAALDSALDERPDLVLTDVMMPRLDGFGLLREMRADPALQAVPIILLSARAGEEARVEGLEAGADDYLIKPFQARELLAKVSGTLKLARVRATAMKREAELEAERTEILDSMNLAFIAFDEDFRFVYINAEAAEMHGLTRDEYLGRTQWEAFPASIGTNLQVQYERAMSERVPLRFENFYEPWARWFELNAYPMTGGRLGVFFRDITERKRLDEELRASEERHRLLAETMLQGVVHQDATGRIIAMNPAAERILGKTREAFLGITSSGIEHETIREDGTVFPGDRHPSIVALQTGEEQRDVIMGVFNPKLDEYRWINIDAVPVMRDGEGKPSEVYAIFEDITERKRAGESLRKAHRELQTVLSSITDGLAVLDKDWRYTYVSDPAARIIGVAPEELLGGVVWELYPRAEGTKFYEGYHQAVATGQAVHFEEYYPEPLNKWLECHCYPSEDGLSVYFRDISQRKRAEQALAEAKETAEAANSSKDRFLAVLSHELRTPLTPVLMAIDALADDPSLPAAAREDLVMMKRNIELETKLIDDLLDLNRVKSGKLALQLKPVDLNEVVRHVCGICQPRILENRVHLVTELAEDVGLINADPARLQQILWNLLNNAIKFTPREGTIYVTTARLSAERCEVRVRDSGIGIPAQRLSRIFDAFEQGDAQITRQFGGLGLGLAICRALVELHEGSIRAESGGEGEGSTFSIELPGRLASSIGATPAAPAASPGEAQTIRVLLVEDHADTARTLQRLLTRAGFAVTVAGSVVAALVSVDTGNFDIIVSDLGLPDGTGYELIQRIREGSRIPAIATSGYGMAEDIERSQAAGFTEHLVKPIQIAQLVSVIRRLTVGEN